MSIDISGKDEARLKATAQAKSVSVDAYVERLVNEREELFARAAAGMPPLFPEEARGKIERGLLQSERGEPVDGETFSSGLLADLSVLEHKQRAG